MLMSLSLNANGRTVKNNHEHLSKYVVNVEFSAWKFPINWWLLSYKNQQKGEFS